MTRRSPRSTLFPYSTLLRSHKSQGRRGGPPYFSCSLWLSPHFRRKFCVRIAQERRLATRSTHSTSAFVFYEKVIIGKAHVATPLILLVLFPFCPFSRETFALGSLMSV